MTVARAPGRVLPTLDEDGTRIRIRPRPSHGRYWKARGVLAWALIALFLILPFVEIGGRPALLIDLARRELALFGTVFRPSDGAVLMLLGITIVLGVFLVTALWGRVWCGWACPQTVYLEWVYRPLERAIEGKHPTTARRALKYAVFGVLSILVANIFLAYFVPVDELATWVTRSPVAHPAGFLVMAAVSALMFLDFTWFREQTCMVACPYGRLQTMMIDRQSMIVGYDARRGEPRGKLGKATGDCVDCRACVATCPAGIDIREGLQMECINCAQCVDACDAIMDRVNRPRGLIRYSSQDELEGKRRKILRPRTVVYPALLAISLGLLVWQAGSRPDAEVWSLRLEGAPFVVLEDGRVSTQARLRIENRSGEARRYTVTMPGVADLELATPRAPIEIAAGASTIVPVVAFAPANGFVGGERVVTIRVDDGAGFVHEMRQTFLGPEVAR